MINFIMRHRKACIVACIAFDVAMVSMAIAFILGVFR